MKKSFVLLLCIFLIVVLCACSGNVSDRELTEYEQSFYALHEAGQKTSVPCDSITSMFFSSGDSASCELSLSTTDHICTFVVISTSEVDGLEMDDRTIDVQFTAIAHEYYKGTYEVSEDGTVYTCSFTEKRMAMDVSEEFTSSMRTMYLTFLRGLMLVDSAQAQYYQASIDLLEGKAAEDPGFERLECVLRKEGEGNRLVSISNYQDGVCNEQMEFGEDTILHCYIFNSGESRRVIEYDYSGNRLAETFSYSTGSNRTEYYPNGGTKAKIYMDSDGLLESEERYDENGSLTYRLTYSNSDSVDDRTYNIELYEDGFLVRETDYYADGQINYEVQWYPVLDPDTGEPVRKSCVGYAPDGTLHYSYECPDSSAPDTYTEFYLNDDKTSSIESWQDGRMIRGTYYYANGQIDTDQQWYPVLDPDTDEFILKSSVSYDEDGTLSYSYECPDSSAPGTYTTYWINDDQTSSFHSFQDGRPIRETRYYADGQIKTDQQWYPVLDPDTGEPVEKSYVSYEEDGSMSRFYECPDSSAPDSYTEIIKWTHTNPDYSRCVYTEFQYQNGTLILWIDYDADWEKVVQIEYNEHGDETAHYYYDEYGCVIRRVERSYYSDGNLASIKEYDASGNVIAEIKYDENGNVIY